MSKRLKSFFVFAKLNLDLGITIRAESLEEAIAASKSLQEKDFVDIYEEFNSGDMRITGVAERD